jgi:hypothetical protein
VLPTIDHTWRQKSADFKSQYILLMKESEFIKLNFKFEISNFCANLKVKITSLRTTVRQLTNTLTVREFILRTTEHFICPAHFIFLVTNQIGC